MTTLKEMITLKVGNDVLVYLSKVTEMLDVSRSQFTECLYMGVILIDRLRSELHVLESELAKDILDPLAATEMMADHLKKAAETHLADLRDKSSGSYQRFSAQKYVAENDTAVVYISKPILRELGSVLKRWGTDRTKFSGLLYRTVVHIYHIVSDFGYQMQEYQKDASSLSELECRTIEAQLIRGLQKDVVAVALTVMSGMYAITPKVTFRPLSFSHVDMHNAAISDMVLMADLAEARGNKELAAALEDARKIAILLDIIDD